MHLWIAAARRYQLYQFSLPQYKLTILVIAACFVPEAALVGTVRAYCRFFAPPTSRFRPVALAANHGTQTLITAVYRRFLCNTPAVARHAVFTAQHKNCPEPQWPTFNDQKVFHLHL